MPREAFLVPKPSNILSTPSAIICYNTFDYDEKFQLSEAKTAALNFQRTLLDLGWQEKFVECIDNWAFESLIDQLEDISLADELTGHRCSILILCITTYGQDEKVVEHKSPESTGDFTLGNINRILDMVATVLPNIPKVTVK